MKKIIQFLFKQKLMGLTAGWYQFIEPRNGSLGWKVADREADPHGPQYKFFETPSEADEFLNKQRLDEGYDRFIIKIKEPFQWFSLVDWKWTVTILIALYAALKN